MKSLYKQLLALLGCITIISGLFVMPAAADSESIVITCTEQLSNQSDDAWKSNYYEWYPGDMGLLIRKADWDNQPILASFLATIPESGWYDVEFILAAWSTTRNISIMATTYSKVEYWIDNGEAMLLADANLNPDSPTVETLSATPLGGGSVHADDGSEQYTKTRLLEPIYLEKGDHTFNFRNISLNVTNSALKASYHSITLTPFDGNKSQKIHAGNYPNLETTDAEGNKGIYTTTVFANSENGGNFIHLSADESDNGSVDGFKINIPFKVYSDGVYDITLDMCSYSTKHKSPPDYRWASPVMIKLDDGDYSRIKTFATQDEPDITAKVINDDIAEKYSADSEKLRWVEYGLEPMTLTAGEHILTFWVYDKPPLQNKDLFVFGLGEINIVSSTADAMFIIEGENLSIEDTSSVVSENGYSNGKYLTTTQDVNVKKKFYISEAGNYKLQAIATSVVDYNIDNKTLPFEKTEDISDLIAKDWKRYITSSVYLEEGVHQLEVKTNAETVAYKLDCIEIFNTADVSGIEVMDLDVLLTDDSAEIIFQNQDGKIISSNNFDSVYYESSNENIVKVNGLGRIRTVNAGEAIITIKVTANGESFTDDMKVIVAGKSGLYVDKAVVNGNDVSVTVGTILDTPASKAFIGVYGVKNGLVTSLKDVQLIDFSAITAGETKTNTVTMSSIEDDDIVIVSVFDGSDILKHLWGKSIVK